MKVQGNYCFESKNAFLTLIALPVIVDYIKKGEIVIHEEVRRTKFLGQNDYKYCKSVSIKTNNALVFWRLCLNG